MKPTKGVNINEHKKPIQKLDSFSLLHNPIKTLKMIHAVYDKIPPF